MWLVMGVHHRAHLYIAGYVNVPPGSVTRIDTEPLLCHVHVAIEAAEALRPKPIRTSTNARMLKRRNAKNFVLRTPQCTNVLRSAYLVGRSPTIAFGAKQTRRSGYAQLGLR